MKQVIKKVITINIEFESLIDYSGYDPDKKEMTIRGMNAILNTLLARCYLNLGNEILLGHLPPDTIIDNPSLKIKYEIDIMKCSLNVDYIYETETEVN